MERITSKELDQAIAYFKRGDARGALGPLQKHLKKHPEDLFNQIFFGHLMKECGMYKEALEFMIDFTRKHPDYEAGWHFLGVMYYKVGDYNNMDRAYSRFLEIEPAPSNTYTIEGRRLLKAGDRVGAKAAFLKAIEKDPDKFKPELHLMKMDEEAQKDPTGNEFDAIEAILARPATSPVGIAFQEFWKGQLEEKKGNPDAACTIYRKALMEGFVSDQVLVAYGLSLFEKKKFMQARYYWVDAMQEYPKCNIARFLLYLTGEGIGLDLDTPDGQATEAILSEIVLNQTDAEPWAKLALLMILQHDQQGAALAGKVADQLSGGTGARIP
nr:hypothetical protein [Candidatus Sigynarchaeum springense]